MSTCPVTKMAEVLSEMVPEIKDRTACRVALAFYGFSDQDINVHLRGAQHLARQLRGAEADRLYLRQFEHRWRPQRKSRHG